MADAALRKLTFGLLATAIPLAAIQVSLYNVDGGERAVIFSRFTGVQSKVIGEGTHLLVPFVQKPYIFDIRTRPSTITTDTGSKDLQTVKIQLRVLHHPEEKSLPSIFKNLGPDYVERVLPAIGNEVMKAVVAQYKVEELITKREAVSHQIRVALTKRASEFHLVLDDISIVDLQFTRHAS
eukprot:TRINITY_DN2981_c0_g1_i1.p1 TRINITY_DN2981_c0_g1~~TRINITY_DN2981_c0_g1_i1.p1  ORF type:complete len:200 (+),score=69.87 TRINITY_DN2981_c0_g1_i1:58-600(+)